MLIYFERPFDAGSVAINPQFVMLVEDCKAGTTNIVMVDGGTTKVRGNYMEVIGRLNGELK
jgi:hypothetical protein